MADDRVFDFEEIRVLFPVLLEARLVTGAVVELAAVTGHLKSVTIILLNSVAL